ncbi:MAG: hypothetical protein JSR79_14365 [Proteobacteria bacterium]|nr:hypothetical protein [Pseudomonadota bacterium]
MVTAPMTYQCRFCGTNDVVLDAWAKWDERDQRWMLEDTLQAAYCRRCDGETSLVERALTAA